MQSFEITQTLLFRVNEFHYDCSFEMKKNQWLGEVFTWTFVTDPMETPPHWEELAKKYDDDSFNGILKL